MANTPNIPKKVDPDAQYRVQLLQPVQITANLWARPGDDVVVSGAFLTGILDKVGAAELA